MDRLQKLFQISQKDSVKIDTITISDLEKFANDDATEQGKAFNSAAFRRYIKKLKKGEIYSGEVSHKVMPYDFTTLLNMISQNEQRDEKLTQINKYVNFSPFISRATLLPILSDLTLRNT